MRKFLISMALLAFLSCSDDDNTDFGVAIPESIITKAKSSFISVSTLPPDGISADKIALGKKLYYDNRLSLNNTVSCNSCHNLSTFGVDNASLSIGDSGELGGRNSPSSIYSFLQFRQFWDGRAETVEEQAGGPILNPVEHGIPSEEYLITKIKGIQEYQNAFKRVFPNDNDPITFTNLTNAIGAFERQLHPVSKLDRLLDGNTIGWTQQEVDGLSDFIDNKCATCHNGIAVGGQSFLKFGYYGNYAEETHSAKIDNGRFDITADEKDRYVFKVPSLRNVEKTYPYFHDGSVADLKEAIRIMAKLQSNIELSSQQIDNIEAFLKTLTADVDARYKQ